jgi:hypothetical protein
VSFTHTTTYVQYKNKTELKIKTNGFQTFFCGNGFGGNGIVPFSFLAEKGYGGNGQYYFGENGKLQQSRSKPTGKRNNIYLIYFHFIMHPM